MKLLIMIPAYNEAENIERVAEELRQCCPQYDFVVINDGSRDQTAEICRKRGYPLLDLPVNLGLAGAFQTGMRYAWRCGYDAAVQLDGDGQHDPRYIADMVAEMEKTKADIIIGSRFKTQKKPHTLRMLGSNMIEMAIYLTTRHRITDPTSGMRLFSRAMVEEFANNLNYGPEPDTISYLISRGARVSEIGVTMRERIAGESYLNMTRAMRYMMHMCSSIIFIQFFRKRRV